LILGLAVVGSDDGLILGLAVVGSDDGLMLGLGVVGDEELLLGVSVVGNLEGFIDGMRSGIIDGVGIAEGSTVGNSEEGEDGDVSGVDVTDDDASDSIAALVAVRDPR